jgi:hypothetical protein
MNGNQGGFGNYAYMASMSASKLPVSEVTYIHDLPSDPVRHQ